MHNRLHGPIYMHGGPAKQAPIPMRPPPPPEPEPIRLPTPEPEEEPEEEIPVLEPEEINTHLPILICNLGNKIVIPHEATRDVMAGRCPYYLCDENGIDIYKPKHIFAALKLEKKKREKYEDYPCIGAHQRFLEKRGRRRRGQKHFYISDIMFQRGEYVSNVY